MFKKSKRDYKMNFVQKVHKYYIKALEDQEALGAKPSTLDTSRHILNTIHKTVYSVDSLSRDDHHPEIKKAFDHVKKLYDKHSALIDAEIQKIDKNPQPSPQFTEALKEISKQLKSLSGPNTKVDIKTKSTSEKEEYYRGVFYFIYTRSVITLSRDSKKFYVSCFEKWIPEQNETSYGVISSTKEPDANIIKLKKSNEYSKDTLTPKYDTIEDHMLEQGYKEAKGKHKHKLLRSQLRSLFPEATFKESETDLVFNVRLENDIPEFHKSKLDIQDSTVKKIESYLNEMVTHIKKLKGKLAGSITFEPVDSYDGQGYSYYPEWTISNDKINVRQNNDEGTPKGWDYLIRFSIAFSKTAKLSPEDIKKIHSIIKNLKDISWSSRRSYW